MVSLKRGVHWGFSKGPLAVILSKTVAEVDDLENISPLEDFHGWFHLKITYFQKQKHLNKKNSVIVVPAVHFPGVYQKTQGTFLC